MSAPREIHAAAAAQLEGAPGLDALVGAGGLSPDRRQTFALRLDRYWPDLESAVHEIHPDPDVAAALLSRLAGAAATAYAERPADLHRLDQQRLLTPDWLQQPQMFGYACYADRFAGDLKGVAKHLDHLEDLGVTYLHLMPLLEPREGDNDGGYAVQDYRAVRPDLGTIEDLRELATTLRGQGISLVMDLVLNHVAREHDWAARARAGEAAYRDYFHVFPDRDLPDQFEQTLPEVFPAFAPGNFTWDDELDGWVWTTFNEWQWDLNWANPAVLAEFVEIILWLANLGVEVFRLDAIAFLWKRMGTSCQNQPEVHAITQALHALTRIAAPAVAFKAEAIVGPRDLVQYLGTGPARRPGQRPRLPQQPDGAGLVDAGRRQHDPGPARARRAAADPGHRHLDHLRALPRRHRLGDRRLRRLRRRRHRARAPALPLRLVRRHLPRVVGGGAGLPGQPRRPATRASAAPRPPWPGSTRVSRPPSWRPRWPGSSWRTRSRPAGAACRWCGAATSWPSPTTPTGRPRRATRTTTAGRTGRGWTGRAPPPGTTCGPCPAGCSPGLAHLARVRAGLPQLHASAVTTVLQDTDDGVLAVVRQHASGTFVGLYNVTAQRRPFPMHRLRAAGLTTPYDALGGHLLEVGGDGVLWLPAYAAWWVVDAPA